MPPTESLPPHARALRLIVGASALPLLLSGPLAADTITLTNGRVIEADRTWFEGSQLRYQKDGGVYGLPRSLVREVDQRSTPEPSADPDVVKARERLAEHDPAGALKVLQAALARDPQSLPALQAQVEAHLGLGEARAARDAAERAVRVDDRNPRSRALLGDALAALGERSAALEQYRVSLRLHPDPDVQRKLAEVAPPLAPPPSTLIPEAQLRVRYDGGVNEPLGMAVLRALDDAYAEYRKRLGFSPEQPVTVVLQTNTGFQDTTRAPDWADGWNDGTIRVPVMGLDRPTPRLLRVLRHELAHSFVASRTGNNCPVWLQEGIAQWLEGGDPAREDAQLAPLARAGRLPSLVTLEGPFRGMSETEATVAYAQSLSAVAHIVRKRGEAGVVRLIAALSDRLPSEEALPVALALSYPEFQKSWEEYLREADRKAAGTPPAAR